MFEKIKADKIKFIYKINKRLQPKMYLSYLYFLSLFAYNES